MGRRIVDLCILSASASTSTPATMTGPTTLVAAAADFHCDGRPKCERASPAGSVRRDLGRRTHPIYDPCLKSVRVGCAGFATRTGFADLV